MAGSSRTAMISSSAEERVPLERAEVGISVGLDFLGSAGQQVRNDSFVAALELIIQGDIGGLTKALNHGARASEIRNASSAK